MRKVLIFSFGTLALLALILFLIFLFRESDSDFLLSPFSSSPTKPANPYADYTFDALSQRQFAADKITIGNPIEGDKNYSAYFFYFSSAAKKVSGAINLPLLAENLSPEKSLSGKKISSEEGDLSTKLNPSPIIIMIRGYADKEIYFTGLGTRKAAAFFAQNGFVTLAPDFLGFGQSDDETLDILLNRFQRPETILSLLASLSNLNQSLEKKGLPTRVDPQKVFLWGHSNGGQIAISILEITRRSIPTVLWAPVTAGFPESILNYASEQDEGGQKVINAVEELKSITDPKLFSITEYLSQTEAPLQIHQGTADEYLSPDWTDSFVSRLKELGKNVTFYSYYKDDHNLKKNWDLVIQRDLKFFQSFL